MASSSTRIQDEQHTRDRSSTQDSSNLTVPTYSNHSNPFSALSFWVSRSFWKMHFTCRFSGGQCPLAANNCVLSTSSCSSPCFLKEENVSSSLASEMAGRESRSSTDESSSASSGFWRLNRTGQPDYTSAEKEPHPSEERMRNQGSVVSEMEMMKERFSKLLLGEDMSGCGNGVCTALAISNAITNLCATLFGQLWRLQPLPLERKSMWRREMEWLLSITDHIVELEPSQETFSDGSKLEVMTCRPRPDIYINLPALCKLDNMLLEILDSFQQTEFWYVDQGILTLEVEGSSSFRKVPQRQEEKWWLPIPRVPPDGLSEDSRKCLQNKRECTNQIFKASTAINAITLAEMEVPESYLNALPKNARACLGDIMYRYITSDQFYPEYMLDCLDLSSEHHALEIANTIEASIFIWRKRTSTKPIKNTHTRSNSRSSWDFMKELMTDHDKRELLADRAENLLHCLKQRFPGLPQTTLDTYRLQFNMDVGKSILESYSRVLESLAFNIVARIDDLLYVDDLTKHMDGLPPNKNYLDVAAHKKRSVTIPPHSVPALSTPYRTAFTTPSFSPAGMISTLKEDPRSSFTTSSKIPVKRALNNYFSEDGKGKDVGASSEKLAFTSSRMSLEALSAQNGKEQCELAGSLKISSPGELA